MRQSPRPLEVKGLMGSGTRAYRGFEGIKGNAMSYYCTGSRRGLLRLLGLGF